MSAYLQQMSSVDYFNKLQERVGHHRNDDPKELTTDDLVTLGRALAEEHRFITGGMNASGKMEQVLMQIMAFQNDHPSLEHQIEQAKDLGIKVRTIGYGLQSDPPADKKRRLGLRDEQWLIQRQVAGFAAEYEGQLKKLWLLYADWMAREIHHYAGHEMELGLWVGRLRSEFEKRQPGYKPKTMEEIIEENAMSPEDFEAMFGDEDEEDWELSDADIAMEVLEDQLRESQLSRNLLQYSYDRLERIALGKEKANEEEILALRQAQYELSEEKHDTRTYKINFIENLELLKQMRPEGHTLSVNVRSRNDHFKRDLCLRYGIALERDVYRFHVNRLSHLNNYYGHFEGHKNTEVIIGLNINTKNKVNCEHPELNDFRAKTALLPFSQAEDYLRLEREHCPGGVDFSRYTMRTFLEAHRKIRIALDDIRKKRAGS